MADENAARWGAWLRAELDRRGMRQVDLIERARGELKPAVVSKWYRGDTVPTVESVIAVARALNADITDALRNSGHHRTAEVIGAGLAELPGPDTDPVVQRIRRADVLSDAERKLLEESYLRSRSDLVDYFLNRVEEAQRLSRGIA